MNPRCVELKGNERFLRLLAGAPQTRGMKSGYVTLKPGESVGEHAADGREECVIVLEGTAEVSVQGEPSFRAEGRSAVYISPGSVHDIRNAGATPLRYVYVTAPLPGE
jgi:quercetin dioxygenase-like cupin family protein